MKQTLWLLFIALALQANAETTRTTASTCDSGRQIQQLVREALEARGVSESDVLPYDAELCSHTVRVRQGDAIEIMKVRWDEVLRSIEFRLRCQSAAACLPFLLNVQTRTEQSRGSFLNGQSNRDAHTAQPQTEANLARARHLPRMVRPGQMVTLIWEQGDMHISRQVICLDAGSQDQEVRTRGKDGGRVVRARVMAAGVVKAL